MNIRPLLITTLVICALGASAWWISQRITVSLEDQRKPPEKDIRLNPMSALEQLLLHFEVKVQSNNNRNLLHNLPATNEAIVVRNLKQPLTHERELALLNWVEQGGKLIYEPYWLGKSDERQYFHEKMGVLIQEIEDWQDIQRPNHAWSEQNNEDLYFHMSPQYVLSLQADSPLVNHSKIVIASDVGAHGIQVNHGQGSVLFLSDSDFLSTPKVWQPYYKNDKHGFSTDLSRHDHAYFMWLQLKDSQKVWLLYETSSPAFLSIVYKHFPALVLFSATWLLLFLLYLLKRFGPVVSQLPGEQRNLKQHIQQVGYFHWHQDKGNHLLNSWRSRIQHRVFVKHPNLAGLQDNALYDMLASLSGCTPADIQQAWSEPCHNQTEFITYTKRLKKLWTM